MKTILITGGNGLVGSAIKKISTEYNFNFIYLKSSDCDLRNYDTTKSTFEKIKPSIIIHLAANVGGLYKNINSKVKMYEDNIYINTNVIKCAYEIGVKNLIACLSTCVFPDNLIPLTEKKLHQGPPHYSNEGYAYAKRMLEIQCRIYNESYGTNYGCIIPTNIYGTHDNFNLEDSHVVPGLIHRCYIAKKNNEPFVIRGTGKALREFIYSIDLAKIIMLLVKIKFNEIVLVSPGIEYSIKDVGEIIAKQFAYNNIVFDDSFSDGQIRKSSDNSKLLDLIKSNNLNFEFTDLKSGISESIDYFIKNYDIIRK